MQGAWRATWAAAAVAFIVGCGSEPTGVLVKGTVKVDGNPAESGAITFTPTSGKGAFVEGEIVNGAYTAMPFPGPHKVEVRVRRKVKEVLSIPTDPNSFKTAVYDEIKLTPDTQSQSFDVPAGGGEFNAEVKSTK